MSASIPSPAEAYSPFARALAITRLVNPHAHTAIRLRTAGTRTNLRMSLLFIDSSKFSIQLCHSRQTETPVQTPPHAPGHPLQ